MLCQEETAMISSSCIHMWRAKQAGCFWTLILADEVVGQSPAAVGIFLRTWIWRQLKGSGKHSHILLLPSAERQRTRSERTKLKQMCKWRRNRGSFYSVWPQLVSVGVWVESAIYKCFSFLKERVRKRLNESCRWRTVVCTVVFNPLR